MRRGVVLLQCVSRCHVRMYSRQVRFARWWGDIPFLPVEKPRPALQWLKNLTQGQHVLAGSCSTHVHSTSSAGRGSLSTTKHRQRRNANDGMHNYVRSEMSRVHRGPRTERREFASLEPLKGEKIHATEKFMQLRRGDLLEPDTGRRARGGHCRVESRYPSLVEAVL